MGTTGVYIELEDGAIKKTNYEVLTLARKTNNAVNAVVFTDTPEQYGETLKEYGVGEIIAVTGLEDQGYNAEVYASCLSRIVGDNDISILIGTCSARGRDLFPRVAAAFEAPLVNDCLDVDFEQSVATKPMYAGKVISRIKVSGDKQFFTLRPNVVESAKAAATGSPAVKKIEASDASPVLQVKEIVKSVAMAIDLTEANIIVSGGRGMKNQENFALLQDLAKVLGAAVGASRAAVDAGYATQDIQVGQTGKVVNPKLYIACGISGAIQHLAGMKTSKVIVAVNKDPDAPIFQKADYGIVGDLFEVVPLLKQELLKVIK